jgi:hypothetical protein
MKKKTTKSQKPQKAKRRRNNNKEKYLIRNWSEYNRALEKRGSLTLWVEEEAIAGWLNEEKSGKRGRSNTYADMAIETMSILKSVYYLQLRATRGLTNSLMKLMGIELPIPCYTTLCRRRKNLDLVLPRLRKDEAMHWYMEKENGEYDSMDGAGEGSGANSI